MWAPSRKADGSSCPAPDFGLRWGHALLGTPFSGFPSSLLSAFLSTQLLNTLREAISRGRGLRLPLAPIGGAG